MNRSLLPSGTRPSRVRSLVLVGALLAAACDSPSDPDVTASAEVGVVVNSVENSLTVFRVDDPAERRTIGLGPDGSPVTLAVRGALAVVPLGIVPAAAFVDLDAGAVVRTVALPEGSGATGAAFLNDSIVVVANPGLASVTPIHARTGARLADVAVGAYPQFVVAVEDTAFVVNARLGPDFQPTGPGTVSVLAGTPLAVVRTVPLSGLNPGAATLDGGRLYVLHAGRFGESGGSLSVVDRRTLAEIGHHEGFGSFPGGVAAEGGRVFVSGFGLGLLVWDASTASLVRGPANAVALDGVTSVSGVGVDAAGRLYALAPDCQGPSAAHRLGSTFESVVAVPVGICPVAIAFGEVGVPEG